MKPILITGAAGGIGNVLCKELKKAGYFVIGSDIKQPLDISIADDWLTSDLSELATDEKKIKIFADKVRSKTNDCPIFAIVHNAAIQKLGKFSELSLNDWSKTIEVNLLAPILINKEFIQDLKKVNGSIINISSIHSKLTKENFISYSTSKAALNGLTKGMAVELGSTIRVNAISPAAIETEMLREGFKNSHKKLEKLKEYHPTLTIGKPIDIARGVLFLLDDQNSFLNGCILEIGGGLHNRLHDPL